jgi:hypothetical protein
VVTWPALTHFITLSLKSVLSNEPAFLITIPSLCPPNSDGLLTRLSTKSLTLFSFYNSFERTGTVGISKDEYSSTWYQGIQLSLSLKIEIESRLLYSIEWMPSMFSPNRTNLL